MSKSDNSTSSPQGILVASQLNSLSLAVADFSQHQLIWASGYLAGRAEQTQLSTLSSEPPSAAIIEPPVVTVIYASQTGNGKGVAHAYTESLNHLGFKTNLVNVSDYNVRQLKKEQVLIVVASTHGEGDPPDDAVDFHEFLFSKKAPKLPNLEYAVIGLGDTSYEFFCQTAKDIDLQLEKHGANRLIDRLDCDVDYDFEVQDWTARLTDILKTKLQQAPSADIVTLPSNTTFSETTYSKTNPFEATFLQSQKITGRYSSKDIRHLEISLEDSNITYQPGDSLGVWFENDQTLASQILSLLSIESDTEVQIEGNPTTIQDALITNYELTQSYGTFLKAYAELTHNDELKRLGEDKNATREYLSTRQIIDVIRQHPATISATALLSCLRKMTPRLYSIASSQEEVEDEVHLTVGVVEYDAFGEKHQGGASSCLSHRLSDGDTVRVFVEQNNNFRLPSDGNTPVIMIGPGTGIAPFRAFMQQRDLTDGDGDNWLFFGNPKFSEDFLYQVEWQRYVKRGVLNKISLAFSRDQEHKIYVQDRIRENGEELCDWLARGAHIYVCGDAERMAKDVHNALRDALVTHMGKQVDEADNYLNDLRKEKRYQKDVY